MILNFIFNFNYQLAFRIPAIEPDRISFKKMCLEKVVNLLNRFLFTVHKHLFVIEIFELSFVVDFNFKKAFHLIKIKKLKFIKITRNLNL